MSFVFLYSFKIISLDKEFTLKGKVYIYNTKDTCKGATVFVYSKGKELSGNTDNSGSFSITYRSNTYQNTQSDTLEIVVLHNLKKACGVTTKDQDPLSPILTLVAGGVPGSLSSVIEGIASSIIT